MAMNRVFELLDTLNIPYIIDNDGKSLSRLKLIDGHMTIATNTKFFRSYDDYHPERILCMLVKKTKSDKPFWVIPKNREFPTESMINRFWNNDNLLAIEKDSKCAVCYNKLKTFHSCIFCNTYTCVKCFDKMNDNNSTTKCVVCRRWMLDGSDYGMPYIKNPKPISKLAGANPLQKFISFIKSLDGETIIIPRLNNKFIMFDEPLSICRLSFTNRLESDSLSYSDLFEILDKFIKKNIDSGMITFWVIHQTYLIDKELEKPIKELTVIQIRDKEIIPYGNDAYINVLSDDLFYTIKKVEFLEPYKPDLPQYIKDAFDDINQRFPFEKTVSIIPQKNIHSCNFDVDKDGNITTMAIDMLKLFVDSLLNKTKVLYITIRIHTPNGTQFASYKINESFKRLPLKESRVLFNTNIDGLKKSKYIVEFLGE